MGSAHHESGGQTPDDKSGINGAQQSEGDRQGQYGKGAVSNLQGSARRQR